MDINEEGPELESFCPDHAIQLWWSACTHRPNQILRKVYRKILSSEGETSNESKMESTLDVWDCWFSNTGIDSGTDSNYTTNIPLARTCTHD